MKRKMNPTIDLRHPIVMIAGRRIVNQDPSVISIPNLRQLSTCYLPAFLSFWASLEKSTGYRWYASSLIRDSISHEVGQAIDLVPDISDKSWGQYAVNKGSDPVLYKREPLIRAIQSLLPIEFFSESKGGEPYALGIFIEPDHLHVQVIKKEPNKVPHNRLIKWGQPKPVYQDTYSRMKLPLITS